MSFWINAKRIRRDRGRKPFVRRDIGCFYVRPWYEQTASEIYRAIRDKIVEVSKMKEFRGRYFDLEVFDAIGPYINWHRLLDLSPEKPLNSKIDEIIARSTRDDIEKTLAD